MKTFALRLVFFMAFTFGLSGCDKTSEEQVRIEGVYKGTFERRGLQDSKKSNVTITFEQETWTGTGDLQKYPALCNGRFLITMNQIKFSNLCSWPGDFDSTYVLSGDYALQFTGGTMILTKRYSSGLTDVYTLTKQ
ncbi:hypothetical protein [Pedobacter sp. SYP-B3415]|uniref:hypothetical protein n=1 Tax=Pedobacter sp. SYP-B3415 TaxID=2496641 RepID=UPI00101C3129|nr:hypothetical protein [Pedobacter sp. SYP-B3415]